jgi:hypothetical protein
MSGEDAEGRMNAALSLKAAPSLRGPAPPTSSPRRAYRVAPRVSATEVRRECTG